MGRRDAAGEHEGSRRMKTELLIQMDGCLLFSSRVLLSDGRAKAVEDLTESDTLRGHGGRTAAIVPPIRHLTTPYYYSVGVRDHEPYLVTPGHLVTVMWRGGVRSPFITPSSDTQPYRTLAVQYSSREKLQVSTLLIRLLPSGASGPERAHAEACVWPDSSTAKLAAERFARDHWGAAPILVRSSSVSWQVAYPEAVAENQEVTLAVHPSQITPPAYVSATCSYCGQRGYNRDQWAAHCLKDHPEECEIPEAYTSQEWYDLLQAGEAPADRTFEVKVRSATKNFTFREDARDYARTPSEPVLVMDEYGFATDADVLEYGRWLAAGLTTVHFGEVFEVTVEDLEARKGQLWAASHHLVQAVTEVVLPTGTTAPGTLPVERAMPFVDVRRVNQQAQYVQLNVHAVGGEDGEDPEARHRFILADGIVTHSQYQSRCC